MAMTVRKRQDIVTKSILMHKIADVRGGVSIASSELGGNILHEGTVITRAEDGICKVVKVATITETAEAGKTLKVNKENNFKTGDFLTIEGDDQVAYEVKQVLRTAKAYNTITLDKAHKGVEVDKQVWAVKNGSEVELIGDPIAIVGTSKGFIQGDNIDTDAWVIGVTKGLKLPKAIAEKLPNIVLL